jgi:hypothetical protein
VRSRVVGVEALAVFEGEGKFHVEVCGGVVGRGEREAGHFSEVLRPAADFRENGGG